jgi:dTDP-4-dehydrorhamnose reductase
MKILITGAHGFVGTRLMKELEGAIAAPSIQGMNEKQIRQIVEESEADVIIHTAAISDVGICEKNPEESYYANVLLPVYLAKASDGKKLICFSSDQVYRGCESDGPYREDEAKPANIYGAHKLEMEQRVLDRQPDSVLLRAEWMYDYISPRGNYLLNVLNAKETLTFGRQYRGITYLREVCENLERIVKLPENGLQQSGKLSGETVLAENQPGEQDVILQLPGGVYNFGSETTQSMYEITKEFLQITGSRQQVQEGSLVHNLWMDCSKAAQYGIVFSDVMGGLRRCLADYGLLQ